MPIGKFLRDEHKSFLLFSHLGLRNCLSHQPRAILAVSVSAKAPNNFWASSLFIIFK